MEAHLCNENLVPTEKMIKELILGQSEKTETYTCGECSKNFQTICILHSHCMKHSNGGSYFFNHVTKTAFPKLDSICSYTQVDEDLIANDLSREIADTDVKVMISSARNINKKSKMESDDAGIETASVGIDGVNSETYIDTINLDMTTIPEDDHTNESSYDQEDIKAESFDNKSQKETVDNLESGCFMVTVRNIEKTSEGLFSFEMDEKDAYLFDRTAESIMDRIREEGEEWINGGNEFQIKVSIDRDQLTEERSCEENKAENESNNIESGNNVIDPKANAGNGSELCVKGDNIQDAMMDEKTPKTRRRGRPSKKQISNNHKEVDDDSNTDKTEEALINEIVESDHESSQNSRRSGRKRQVSSRLRDADWEVPGKVKHKRLNSPSNKDQTNSTHGHENIKDSNATRTVPGNMSVEIKDEADVLPMKSDALRNVAEEMDKGGIVTQGDMEDDLTESETVKDVDQTANGNTYSADLSASEVLLSLSKGSKEESILDPDYKTKKGKLKRATNTRSKKVKRRASKGGNSGDGTSDSNELAPSKRKDYTCPTCGKVGNLAMMKYHEQCHSTDKPFTCEVCGKGFKTRPCLVAHVRQHGERQFRCDQCPAAFYRKQYLTSHLLTHSGELPYVCKTCNKGFREMYILHRHNNNVHKNIRNFPCDLCSMMFFRQETLDNHRVRHFPPTLKCNYCSKMFKAELDRRKHELTHTGEKQFFCPKCSYGFSQLWPYYRHMWKKHNINKDEAKRIRIRNKNLVSNRNVNKVVEERVSSEDQQIVEYNTLDNIDNRPVPEDSFDGVNIIYEIKQTPDVIDDDISQYKEGQIVIQQGDGLVTQSGEMVVQSNEDLAVQSTSDVTDLKGIYDHLYVTDAANVANAIQVLTGNLQMEEGTVIMETHEEHPDTGDVSMVQQNIVILSDYSGIEGEYSEIDGYTKEYSSLDL